MVDLMINHEGKICDNSGDSVDQLVPLNDPTRIGRWWCLKCIYKERLNLMLTPRMANREESEFEKYKN